MKTITIEALLRWAYCEELPKAETATVEIGTAVMGSSWDAVAQQGVLLCETVSDGRINSYGVVPVLAWYGQEPHEDAFAVHRAVGELASLDLDVPEGWAPLAGLGLSEEEQDEALRRAMPRLASQNDAGVWRLCGKPAELLRRHAILGGAPHWEAEAPTARFVTVQGKPAWFRKVSQTIRGKVHWIEVDGYNKRSGRPYADAYRKTVLDPDPAQAAIDRAEYEVWHASLAYLAEVLSEPGLLSAHRVLPPAAPARPWEEEIVPLTA